MYPEILTLPEWFPLIGGAPVTSFGVMMLAAFLTGGLILRAEFERTGLGAEHAWDVVLMAIVGGILGAKLFFVGLNFPRLLEDPLRMLTNRGGLVWYGGFIGGVSLIYWRARRSGLPLGRVFDCLAPGVALSYAVGRIGCFLVGDDYGVPTGSWVGVRFPNGAPPTSVESLEKNFGITVDPALIEEFGQIIPVHPTQLYEVALSTLIFLFLWRIRRHPRRAGWLFMTWLTLAGVERFLIEIVRVKDDRFFGVLSVAQVISVGLVVAGATWMFRLSRERSEGGSGVAAQP